MQQRNPRGGYSSSMVGRGYRPMMGAAPPADIQAAADAGDPRAQAVCDALANCGPPAWRQRQIAPGVQAPCDDLYPLPLKPEAGTPTFVSGGPTLITLSAVPQKPFRGERPVSIVTRVGASAAAIVPVIRGALRVGTDPQAAQISDMPLEFLDRTSFGVRMVMAPAEGGITIAADIQLVGPALAAGDTITVFLSIWGSTWA